MVFDNPLGNASLRKPCDFHHALTSAHGLHNLFSVHNPQSRTLNYGMSSTLNDELYRLLNMGFQERMTAVLDELKAKGISASAVAAVIGKTKGTPSGWRSGGIKSISHVEALKMERAYGYRAHWLITGEGPKLVSHDEKIDSRLLLTQPEIELLETHAAMQALDKADRRAGEVLLSAYTGFVRSKSPQVPTAHARVFVEGKNASQSPRGPGSRKRRTK